MVTYLGRLGIKEDGVNWSGTTAQVMVELDDRGVSVTMLGDYSPPPLGGSKAIPLVSDSERFSVFSPRGMVHDSDLVRAIVEGKSDTGPVSCGLKKGDTVLSGYLILNQN